MAKKSQKEKEASAAAKFVAAQIQARKDEEGEQGVEVNFSEVMQQVKGKNAKTKNAEKQDKQSKPKADKQEKPKTETKNDAEKAILTTKEVAAMCGTTPKALRRVLRSKWYNDGIMTHYTWTKDDPILKEIVDHYKAQEKKEAK